MQYTDYKNALPNLKGKIIAFDTEATGLDPWHGDRVFCWAYYSSKGEWGFMWKTSSNLAWLKNLLNDDSKHIVFHNAKYDLQMLYFEGIDVFNLKSDIHDTMVLSKVLDSVEKFHNLRHLSRRYLRGDTSDKDEIEYWLKSNKRAFVKQYNRSPNFSDAPIKLIKKRVLWDAQTTLKLFSKLYPLAKKRCRELYETERKLILVCLDMELSGVTIDISKAKQLKEEASNHSKQIQKELNQLVCPLTLQYNKGKEVIKQFNPNSPLKHLPAAFEKLGISLRYRTKPKKNKKKGRKTGGGNWSFDEYSLIRYTSKPLAEVLYQSSKENWGFDKFYNVIHNIVDKYKLPKSELLPALILKHRELTKLVSTYYAHLIEDCVDVVTTPAGREFGVLHCKFNQSEAVTGRFSSSKPNLQNMPRLLGPRECFIPRKGRKLWLIDYAQVEMRFYAHFAKDKKMAERLPSDLHRWTASEMYKKPPEQITKEERERAGSINFAVIYGSGAATMAETLSRKGSPTTQSKALQFINKYHSIYPSVRKTARKLSHQLAVQGYITNPFGRRYYIPNKFSYKSLNYMCQGTSADLIKKAMVGIWFWLRERCLRTKLLMTIHDELVFEIPYSEEKLVLPKLIQFMEDRTNYFVPITVGIDVAKKRWSQKEKFELTSLVH